MQNSTTRWKPGAHSQSWSWVLLHCCLTSCLSLHTYTWARTHTHRERRKKTVTNLLHVLNSMQEWFICIDIVYDKKKLDIFVLYIKRLSWEIYAGFLTNKNSVFLKSIKTSYKKRFCIGKTLVWCVWPHTYRGAVLACISPVPILSKMLLRTGLALCGSVGGAVSFHGCTRGALVTHQEVRCHRVMVLVLWWHIVVLECPGKGGCDELQDTERDLSSVPIAVAKNL